MQNFLFIKMIFRLRQISTYRTCHGYSTLWPDGGEGQALAEGGEIPPATVPYGPAEVKVRHLPKAKKYPNTNKPECQKLNNRATPARTPTLHRHPCAP